MARLLKVLLAVVLIVGVTSSLGCSRKQPEQVTPLVKPPVIGTEGVLRAGIDLNAPPYAGTDGGKQAGIDIDVAAALAERLGLKLEIVEVTPDRAAEAFEAGTVDVVMSVPLSEQSLANAPVAGTYLDSGPALFGRVEATGSVEPSITIDSLGTRSVAVQRGSLAFWLLTQDLGEEGVTVTDTLREAFKQGSAGDVDLVAGDAVTGSYIARDFAGWRVVGQVGPATLLGVAVGPENTELEQAVRESLDALAADGVLKTIRAKWVGEMPELSLPSTETAQ